MYIGVRRYWGQNSYGATHSDAANFQKTLSYYCGSDSVIDAFPLAFLTTFFGEGGLPSLDLSNVRIPPLYPLLIAVIDHHIHFYSSSLFTTIITLAHHVQICNDVDNATFPGTELPNCASLASDIETCQAKGKIVTIR